MMDRLPEEPLSGKLAESLVIVQITDDLTAEAPEVVHVVANVFRERLDEAKCSMNRRKCGRSCSPGGRSCSIPIQDDTRDFGTQ